MYPLRTQSPPHGFKAQHLDGQNEKPTNQKPQIFAIFAICKILLFCNVAFILTNQMGFKTSTVVGFVYRGG